MSETLRTRQQYLNQVRLSSSRMKPGRPVAATVPIAASSLLLLRQPRLPIRAADTASFHLVAASLSIAAPKPFSETGMVTGLRVTDSIPMFSVVPDRIVLTSSADSGTAA